MNQSQIHPALRQNNISSPTEATNSQYSGSATSTFSPIQPSPNTYQAIQTSAYYPSDQQAIDSQDEHSPGANPADPNDLKRPRACEACRQLKVKCEPDDNNPSGSCKRCAKAHRQCVVTVPSRKRQKKTDSRVAELEKKIDALTASLAARGGGDVDVALDPAIAQQQHPSHRSPMYTNQWQPPAPPPQHHVHSQPSPTSLQNTGIKRKHHESSEYMGEDTSKVPMSKFRSPPVPQFAAAYGETRQRNESDDAPSFDVIDRNILDSKTAHECFNRYKTEMCKELAMVVFPTDMTAEELRRNKPVLFLAVLAVASSTIRPDLQSRLIGEVMKILGDRIICNGEKSMELVQTIQLMTVFYQPPENYEELNFNQLIHVAAVMAMDIGMGKRLKKGPYPLWKGYMEKNKGVPDPNSAEARRCWLGCYYMCTNSAMSLRRPQLIRWSPYADECVQILTNAKDAVPSDRWLCHFVKAQHIAENIGIEFSMDDPAQTLSLTDTKTQRDLKVFEQNLAEWHQAGGEMMNSPIMKHTEAIVNLYMHEIAMHHDHNIDDFRPPYNTTPIAGPPDPDLVTSAHAKGLTACLHSAHNAFEAFLSMDIKVLHALPTHFFVRNSYAAVALIKLYSAVSAKGSKFGSIVEMDELKVESYLDRLIQTLKKVADGGRSKVALKFVHIFGMLRTWHLKRNETSDRDGGQHDHTKREGSESRTLPPRDTSQAWSKPSRPGVEQDSQSRPQPSGLQMLSDAAMDPNRPVGAPSHQEQWIPQPHMGQIQPMPSMGSMGMQGQDYNMMAAAYGVTNDPLAMGGFTSDDFMAFGLGDDWANFGFNQNGVWTV